jgi:formylglycine-generating enzyme
MKRAMATRKTTWIASALAFCVVALSVWWSQHSLEIPTTTAPVSCTGTTSSTSTPHPGMVWIPPGSFAFGDTVYPEEKPVRPVSVRGFWMDRTEVTNAQFAAFVAATGYVTTAERAVDAGLHPGLPPDMQKPGAVVFVDPADLPGGGDIRQWWQYIPGAQWRHPGGPKTTLEGLDALPVVAVTAQDAQAYAQWKGRQLPTEQEWEWAALGGQTETPGNTAQPQEANTWQGFFPLSNQAKDGFARAAPVGCFKPNAYGLFDMIGNVWELTTDRYSESHSPRDNRPPDQAPLAQRPGETGARHVIKGGSFLCAPNYCMRYRAGARQPQEDDLASSHVGFRTVLHAPGP